jgi:hypothetical protein
MLLQRPHCLAHLVTLEAAPRRTKCVREHYGLSRFAGVTPLEPDEESETVPDSLLRFRQVWNLDHLSQLVRADQGGFVEEQELVAGLRRARDDAAALTLTVLVPSLLNLHTSQNSSDFSKRVGESTGMAAPDKPTTVAITRHQTCGVMTVGRMKRAREIPVERKAEHTRHCSDSFVVTIEGTEV